MKRPYLVLTALCFTLLLSAHSNAYGQYYTSSNKKAVKHFEKALGYLQNSDLAHAEEALKAAVDADSRFAEPYLTLGDLYLEQQRHEEAAAAYSRYLDLDQRHQDWRADAEKGLATAQFRTYALSHPVDFNPTNLGPNINTPDDEYLPALTVDGKTLIFTRRFPRKATTAANLPEEEDFYESHRDGDLWDKARRMEEPVNSHGNEGAQCISHDGRIMIFTACGRDDGAGRCDLYQCVWHGNKWGRPRNMGPVLNTGQWESQPSLSTDGKTLYFVSDRSGGYGGLDIWKSELHEGVWTTPVNLGPTINTSGDENSPFMHYDNTTFYFASNGHIGMGGNDLFVCHLQPDGTWSEPQNLGYPINTSDDENKLIVSADGRTAIFSSDKLGGYGKHDLYQFDLPEAVRATVVEHIEPLEEETTLVVGETITLQNVFFATGKYSLYETSLVELDKVAEMMRRHPTMRIALAGHTDNVGHPSDNQRLSEQRAKAVYDYLVAQSIEPQRLTYEGFGDSRPVADNATEEGRQQNRRTTFTILEK